MGLAKTVVIRDIAEMAHSLVGRRLRLDDDGGGSGRKLGDLLFPTGFNTFRLHFGEGGVDNRRLGDTTLLVVVVFTLVAEFVL